MRQFSPSWQSLGNRGSINSRALLANLTRTINQTFTYVARHEKGIQDPLLTLERGSGSCRDLAMLMIEAVRSLGMTARFVTISLNAHDDRLPAKFVGDWCLAEHTADHPSFYRRGRCTNPDGVDDWLTISPDRFDVHEMRCMVLVAHANKRVDYLVKVRWTTI